MKSYIILFVFCSFLTQLHAQNYSEDIAPLIYKRCSNCHRSGEIGPFPLTNYTEVKSRANLIKYVVEEGYMPPWKPDPNYQNYQSENYLSAEEIRLIGDWVALGAPQGDPAKEPPFPNFPTGSQIGTPDLTLSFSKTYVHKGTNKDEYRYFVLPTGLTEDKELIALEMRPGNKQVVHHTLFWADDTGMARAEDEKSPEYGFTPSGSTGFLGEQLPGYVPGQKPNIFPDEMSQKIPKGSDLVLQMHYAPTAIDQTDSSVVNLFFAKKPSKRTVFNKIMLPTNLVNGPFVIPANTTKEFHGVYKVPVDISLLGIWPHCHLLGKSWKVYAKLPTGEEIPLIKIDNWDFNWQGGYYFKKLIVLPKGSEVHAFAVYDNTTDNPFNPNIPPKTITWGEGTTDEMYYLPLTYVFYQPGDERIVLDNEDPEGSGLFTHHQENQLEEIYPNPAKEELHIPIVLNANQKIDLSLRNMMGQKVQTFVSNSKYLQGQQLLNFKLHDIRAGVYVVELKTKDNTLTRKIVIQP